MGRLLSLILAVCWLSGCAGYTLGPIPPTFMKGIHRVAVPVFRNDTISPNIETLATTVVIRQLQQDGTYQITGADRADALVLGTILSVARTKARSLQGNVLASSEFNLLITLNFRIEKVGTHELLGQRNIAGTSSFFVGNDTYSQELQAVPLAVEDAAVQFTSFLSEGW
jgi:hypothetical protein